MRVTLLDVGELFRVHASFVARVLRRAGVAERDLCDATQEVFLVVQRRAHEFEGRSQPRTWLYRIAWNVASETRRRAFRRRELLESPDEPPAREPCALDRLEDQERLAALGAAVAELDPDKREVWLHAELDERPLNELATRRGIPLKTAFSRLYAARRALQRALRERGVLCAPLGTLGDARKWLQAKSASWTLAVAFGALLVPALPPLAPQPSASSASASAAPTELAQRREAVLATTARPARGPIYLAALSVRSRAPARLSSPPSAASEVAPPPAPMRVVRTGAADLGLGPFGESSLANSPLVAPERHPRAKLALR